MPMNADESAKARPGVPPVHSILERSSVSWDFPQAANASPPVVQYPAPCTHGHMFFVGRWRYAESHGVEPTDVVAHGLDPGQPRSLVAL